MTFNLNSKGQISNYLIIPIFIFTFAVMSIFGYYMFSETMDAWEETGLYNEESMDPVVAGYDAGLKILDLVIVLILCVLLVGLGISNFRIKTHPAFFVIVFLMAPFLGFVSFFFNYIFQQIVSQPVFTSTLLLFPRSYALASNLHWIALISIVIGSLTLYAKRGDSEDIAAGGLGGGLN